MNWRRKKKKEERRKKKEEEEEGEEGEEAMSKVRRRKEKTKPWSRNPWNRDQKLNRKKNKKVELVFWKDKQEWQTLS